MRLTYLAVPLAVLMLAGCGNDDDENNIQNEPVPGAGQQYDTPDTQEEPRNMPPASNTDATPPAGGTGLGTERGGDNGEVTDPATGSGTGTTQ